MWHMLEKLSISQLANIIQSDTIDFLVGETWGYNINLINKCGTASLGYFKNRAATGYLLQHYKALFDNIVLGILFSLTRFGRRLHSLPQYSASHRDQGI